jgi:hypothetical protein
MDVFASGAEQLAALDSGSVWCLLQDEATRCTARDGNLYLAIHGIFILNDRQFVINDFWIFQALIKLMVTFEC